MQRSAVLVAGLFAFTGLPCHAIAVNKDASGAPNPIRKVVSLLEAMQHKVQEEGKKEKELYQKFECYCSKGAESLSASIASANTAIPSLGADIASGKEQKTQLEGELKQAQVDRDSAKKAIAEATAIREKQAATYASDKAEYDSNIAAIAKAVAALERGASGSFLQTRAAKVLQQLVFAKADLPDADRQQLAAFLAGEAKYAPKSGEITGILKTLGDSMSKTLVELTATEQAAIKSFQELVAAKKQEIEALTNAIEVKTQRVGELGVNIVQMENDLSQTEKALLKDQEFLANLDTSCKTKAEEMKVREQTRGEELLALSETIKLLNDDESLDLFKHTLPSASASFAQIQATGAAIQAKALEVLRHAQKVAGKDTVLLDRLVLALHGKKIGFEKVLAMIDDMVKLLKKEQQDDEHKKEYCNQQFDLAEDKKKELELSISNAEKEIDNTEESISKISEEIAGLQESLKALDKSVAQATKQRQSENDEYKELLASNNAAKDLLGVAKNRLNKFYNPKLYKPEAKKELSAQDRIVANLGGAAAFVQISQHHQGREDPGAAPETFQGEYSKKSEESTGVIAMIDMLIKDLDKELQEAGVEEKNAQKDYERLMQDSAAKRTADSQLLTEKESTKASLEGQLQNHKDAHASASQEHAATEGYIHSLHGECDWLLQYFDQRKEAREGEQESLEKAKAVLSGASFSLMQTRAQGFLRGSK